MRHRRGPTTTTIVALLVAMVAAACTSGPTPEEIAATEAEEARFAGCLDLAEDVVATLQGYVDQFDPELEAGVDTEVPAAEDLRAAAEVFGRRRAALGCRPREFQLLLDRTLTDLGGEGPLGRAVAARVRDEVAPVTGPVASVTVEVGDDLAAAVHDAGPGAIVQLEPGRHELDEPLVLLRETRLLGTGAETTTIVSSAAGVVVLHAGDDLLTLEGITLEHEGDEPASVLVAPSGSHDLRDVVVRGGVADPSGSAGWGLVVGTAAAPGETAPEQVVAGLVADANQAGGVAVTAGAPTLTDLTASGNGGCGICWLGGATGSLTTSELRDNEVGLSLIGTASPAVSGLTATDNRQAGVVVEGSGEGASFEELVLRGNGSAGLVVRGGSAPKVAGVVSEQHEQAGIVLEGSAAPWMTALQVAGAAIGLFARGDAAPTIDGVMVDDVEEAHVVFADDTAGALRDVDCRGSAPGIALLGATSVDVAAAGCEVVDQRD